MRKKYLIDATIKIVPHGCFRQLLVVYIEYFDEVKFLIYIQILKGYIAFEYINFGFRFFQYFLF